VTTIESSRGFKKRKKRSYLIKEGTNKKEGARNKRGTFL